MYRNTCTRHEKKIIEKKIKDLNFSSNFTCTSYCTLKSSKVHVMYTG